MIMMAHLILQVVRLCIYIYICILLFDIDPYSEPIFMRDQYNCYNNVVS